MKKYKLSPWHDGSVKPVHKGVYERTRSDNSRGYSFWDGKKWLFGASDVGQAYMESFGWKEASSYQCLKWRGILK